MRFPCSLSILKTLPLVTNDPEMAEEIKVELNEKTGRHRAFLCSEGSCVLLTGKRKDKAIAEFVAARDRRQTVIMLVIAGVVIAVVLYGALRSKEKA